MSALSTVCRGLFALAFLNSLIAIWIACKIIHFLPGLGPKKKRNEYSIAFSSLGFKYLLIFPCPWVRIHGLKELESKWKEISSNGAPYLMANHNSKLDSLLLTGLIPIWLGPKLRGLIKEALFKEPLFGGICSAVGHFPVYFIGSKEGDFGVNKEAQGKVSIAMDDFVKNGGGLLIYPEGQLNKNPRTIQPLRRGSFSLPIAHKKAIWGFLNVGCERAWPYKCAVGGFPSDIYVKVFKVTDDASKYNNIELADYAREVMQKNLDDMYAVFDGKKEE